jgi:ketosteroid isomerase-like protein
MPQESSETAGGVRTPVSSLSAGVSRRRSPEQRLSIRFPSLYRLISRSFFRLPARSRLRRSALARNMALVYAAANRRDFDVVLVGLDPGFEYRPSADLRPPDLEPVFHGHDGYLKLWRYWLEAFEDIHWEPEEILDLGETLIVTTQQKGRGSGSGVAVSEPVFQVFHMRDGLVLRQSDFLDRSQALDAASLPPGGLDHPP